MKNKFKYSLKTGERVYSVSEIAKQYDLTNRAMYKLLVKLNILRQLDNKYKKYELVDTLLGETFYFSTDNKYKSKSDYDTTNVTVKFNEKGLRYVIDKLADINLFSNSEFNWKWLENNSPAGQFAISIREPHSIYNNSDESVIYLSYRANRNGSKFSKNYFFISDKCVNVIKSIIKEYNIIYRTNIYNRVSSKDSSLYRELVLYINKIILSIERDYLESLSNNKRIAQAYLERK